MSKAKVTIGRYSNATNPKIYIEITDELSGMTFVHVELDLQAFAMAITGLSMVEGEMELNNLDYVGKRREMKYETVPVDSGFMRYEEAANLATPFEVDGWQSMLHKGARVEVQHKGKRDKEEFYLQLAFVRWVDVDAENEAEQARAE